MKDTSIQKLRDKIRDTVVSSLHTNQVQATKILLAADSWIDIEEHLKRKVGYELGLALADKYGVEHIKGFEDIDTFRLQVHVFNSVELMNLIADVENKTREETAETLIRISN